MQKSQKGFTLIELVVVIVLLGILGATALARFQDLSTEAQDAANEGVASELSSGSSINFAARSLNPLNGSATVGLTCDAAATAVMSVKPGGYSFAAGVPAVCGLAGTSMTCPVVSTATPPGAVANAVVLCI
jgi:prepilin-type N-terminal cleavage/methylation domain-containing protein